MIHEYSCEIDKEKAEFLNMMFPGVIVFKNAMHLHRGIAEAHGGTGDRHIVPPVNFLAAGFPCTDASTLNVHASSAANKNCIADKSKSTGTVFDGIVDHLATQADLLFALLENVTNLASPEKGKTFSNLDSVARRLQQVAGIMVRVWKLDPRMFGTPQSRRRLWISCVPERILEKYNMDVARFQSETSQIMNSLVGWPVTPLDDLLLPAGHTFLTKAHSQALAVNEDLALSEVLVATRGIVTPSMLKRVAKVTKAKKKASSARTLQHKDKMKWHRSHERAFQRVGLNWAASLHISPDSIMLWPGLAQLYAREVEILQYHGINEFPEETLRTIQVSQSLGRCPPMLGVCPAIIPRGRVYVSTKCRLLHPVEALRVHSLEFPSDRLAQVKDAALQDLAGNAFEAGCCLASIVSTLACLASASCACGAIAAESAGSDSDSGDSLFRAG